MTSACSLLPTVYSRLGTRRALPFVQSMDSWRRPGKFTAGPNDNVGSGYWKPPLSSGRTFYLTEEKRMSFLAFQRYEFHTVQKTTKIHPGQTLDFDYAL